MNISYRCIAILFMCLYVEYTCIYKYKHIIRNV